MQRNGLPAVRQILTGWDWVGKSRGFSGEQQVAGKGTQLHLWLLFNAKASSYTAKLVIHKRWLQIQTADTG
jgi:hypothetical protein